IGHALNLVDGVPPEIEPLEAASVLLEYSHNPSGVYVGNLDQLEYLLEIEGIAGISDPYWHWMANIPCSSPLKLEKVVCNRYVYALKSGIYPAKVTAMPVAGVNIPITTAGSVVVMAAEFIVLWLAARLIQTKKIPLVGMPISGTMDMKKGDVSFTAFDAAITRLTVCDFIKQWTGVKLSVGPGEWTPTKVPGLYTTLEKAYFAMLCTWYTGHHPDVGVGHIDSGLTISPVQFVFDLDFTKALKFLEPPVISNETMGIDSILEIGFGKTENFLSNEHTVEFMRTSSWMPGIISRLWFPEAEDEAFDKALKAVKEYKASYKKPEGREDILIKVRNVIERAKKDLCK
ncbi:MAG: trimethylamine methyltransferase family protein, partial [Clostridiales bacterium]|nr:trimethylamine methyltransferase family protein [Clostridiales bacterium]